MSIKFRFGPYELQFNPDEPMTMLDVVALRAVSRDLGIDAPNLAARAMSDLTSAGEATIALAFLCAVRANQDLGWREFLASVPADTRAEVIPDDAPVAEAGPVKVPAKPRSRKPKATPARALGEALSAPTSA